MPRYLGPAPTPGWGRWATDDGREIVIPIAAVPPPADALALPGSVPPAETPAAPPVVPALGLGGPPVPPDPLEAMAPVASAVERAAGMPVASVDAAADVVERAPDLRPPPPPADRLAAATLAAGETRARAAEQSADAMDAVAADQRRLIAEAEKARELADKQVDADMQAYRAEVEGLRATKMRPRRVLEEMSTGGKILAGLGLIASEVVRLRRGGTNDAMEIINKAINDDIRAQELDMENRRQSAAGKLNILQMNMARFRDRDQARAATRAELLGASRLHLEALLQRAQSPLARQEAQAALAKLEIEQQQAEQELALRLRAERRAAQDQRFRQSVVLAEQQAEERDRAAALAAAKAGPSAKAIKEEADARKAVADAHDAEGQLRVPMLPGPDGKPFVAPDRKSAEQLRKTVTDSTIAQALIARAERRLEKLGEAKRLSGTGQDTAEVMSIYAELTAAVNQAAELGALDTSTQKLMEKMLGDPKAITSNPVETLRRFKVRQLEKTNIQLEGSGYEFPTEEITLPGGKKARRRIVWRPRLTDLGMEETTGAYGDVPAPPPPAHLGLDVLTNENERHDRARDLLRARELLRGVF